MFKSLKSFEKAFSVVEILIVIVIVGILFAITTFAYPMVKEEAIISSIKADMTNAAKLIKMYKMDNNRYPLSISECPTPSSDNLCIAPNKNVAYSYVVNTKTDKNFVLWASYKGQVYSINNYGALSDIGQNLLTGDTSIERSSASNNEFTQYTDLAPIFDNYGLHQYTISFDIKSDNVSTQNTTLVYIQNGSDQRHGGLSSYRPVTTAFTRVSITFTPTLVDSNITASTLAFYGIYGTGNKSTVKNVKVELGNIATPWTQAP